MVSGGTVLAWLGALVSVIGGFWGQSFYLPVIGGVLVAIGLLWK